MPDSPFTQRDVEGAIQAIRELTAEIRALPDKIAETYVRKDVLEPRLKGIEDDVAAHGDWFKWGGRIIIGLVFVGLLGLLFVSGGSSGIPTH
jgi:hypothetical protein